MNISANKYTGHGSPSDRAHSSHVEGQQFEFGLSQNNDLQKTGYVSLPILAIGITRIGQGLGSSVLGECD